MPGAPEVPIPDDDRNYKPENVIWGPASFIEQTGRIEGPGELHPEYYRNRGVEPWDLIKAFELDYWRASAVAYLCRAGLKGDDPETGEIDDLRKAMTFIAERIRDLERKKYPLREVSVQTFYCGACKRQVPLEELHDHAD